MDINESISIASTTNAKFVTIAVSSVSTVPAVICVFLNFQILTVIENQYVTVGGTEPATQVFHIWVYRDGNTIYAKNKSDRKEEIRWSVIY